MNHRSAAWVAALAVTVFASIPGARAQAPRKPNTIQSAIYFNAVPKDAPSCDLRVVDNRGRRMLIAAPPVTNPAMSCPDMFSWKLFAEVLSDGFLRRWSSDLDAFPGDGQSVFPWPLCGGGATSNCCKAGAKNDTSHCPYFPGAGITPLEVTKQPAPLRRLKPQALQRFMSQQGSSAGLLQAAHDGVSSVATDDPTRKVRQEMTELVFRNEPMFKYILDNGIYYQEGLARVFANNAADVASNAPYHRANAVRDLTTIEFPVDAVMIKADFLTPAQAQSVGLKNDPANPVIRMLLTPPAGGVAQEYWLIGLHISSKDTPQWVWTTFEYAGNIGRCDFIGCNDSFGFAAPAPAGASSPGNFHEPHTMSDGFDSPATIFNLNGSYPAEVIRPKLAAVFDQTGIGTGPVEVPPAKPNSSANWFPSMKDKAWRSYRLKGSQVSFTDSAGHLSLLGNSVTEAGFVASSSCITCHARANINKCGRFSIGVFEPRVGFQGYGMSSNGVPNPWWYNSNNGSPTPLAVQTDFVWGFLGANATTKNYSCVP
jgi:hypothetical protein